MIEELTNKVYEKISKEYQEYIKNIKEHDSEYIVNNAYEIAIKNEFADMFYGTSNYNKYELQALLKQENALNYLYGAWMSSDGGIHTVIESSMEIGVSDLSIDYISDIKIKLENDSNKELIEIISESLSDFDNYEFCNHLKDKYGIDEIEPVDIYEILNSKDGKLYLYNLFSDLKESDHLQYLNEIGVINSENYNNIDDKILPKLKEMIALDNKNISKNIKKEDRDER